MRESQRVGQSVAQLPCSVVSEFVTQPLCCSVGESVVHFALFVVTLEERREETRKEKTKRKKIEKTGRTNWEEGGHYSLE